MRGWTWHVQPMKFLDVPSSGSIADRTHSRNRGGQYIRNRRSPVQPIGSGRRAFIRSAFGSASAAWASLTSIQQEAWISFAADHPVTDSLGQSIILTGHQMFVAVGTNLLNVAQALPTLPPSDLTLPDVSGATVTNTVGDPIVIGDFSGPTGSFITVAFSKPLSAGRRFTNTFWQPLGADGAFDGESEPATVGDGVYASEFGARVEGQVIFVKVTPISSDGWAGTPIIIRSIVGA